MDVTMGALIEKAHELMTDAGHYRRSDDQIKHHEGQSGIGKDGSICLVVALNRAWWALAFDRSMPDSVSLPDIPCLLSPLTLREAAELVIREDDVYEPADPSMPLHSVTVWSDTADDESILLCMKRAAAKANRTDHLLVKTKLTGNEPYVWKLP